jgi:hypothetical protein
MRGMQWILVAALSLSVPAFVTACGKQQENQMEQQAGPGAELTPAERRAEFMEQADGRMGALQDRMAALRQDAQNLPDSIRAVIDVRLDELDNRTDDMSAGVDTLRAAPDSVWDDMKTDVDTTMTVLERDVNREGQDIARAKHSKGS